MTGPQGASSGRAHDPGSGRPGLPPAGAPAGVGFLLGVAHRAERRRFEARLAGLGLTAPQAAVLRLVASEPGSGVRQLARGLRTDPMNTQRILESLVGEGLCEVLPDPSDARRRPVHATRRGAELAAAASELAAEAEGDLAAALGPGTYQALLDGLRDLVALCAGLPGAAAGSGAPGDDPADGGADHRRRPLQVRGPEAGGLEAGAGQGAGGVAGEMAVAGDVAPEGLDQSLPALAPGPGCAPDVLDHEQAPAGAQYAVELAERSGRVGHRAEHQGGHGRVEVAVGVGEPLGRSVEHRRVARAASQPGV